MKILFLLIIFSTKVYSQHDITNYLPVDYVKDGSIDYTKYLQKGLKENKNVLIPNFPILISFKGLSVESNQIITFQPNSVLLMKPNAETRYAFFNIKNVNDVCIDNPVLIGDKYDHLSDKGEWGMGINILSSTNIEIIKPIISNTWGDGIYIGETLLSERKNNIRKSYTCSNIKIQGGVIDDCLRNGISITSGKNILINGVEIKNINSKSPKAAIDIEPNNRNNIIKNINIRNLITRDNFNGVVIMLVNLISDSVMNIGTIKIENHTDYNSKSSLTISNYKKKFEDKDDYKALEGEIVIENNEYFGTGKIYTHKLNSKFNPKIKFKNISYYKKKKSEYVKNNLFNHKFHMELENDDNVILIK
ncbi:MAG: hypothetical protein ACTHYV_04360 [Psychroflexus sp.]